MLKNCEVCGKEMEVDAQWKTMCVDCFKKGKQPDYVKEKKPQAGSYRDMSPEARKSVVRQCCVKAAAVVWQGIGSETNTDQHEKILQTAERFESWINR